jgi:hypothetical protein
MARSRGLGDVYKRQLLSFEADLPDDFGKLLETLK